MEVSHIAALQVATIASLTRQAASMAIMRRAAAAQMEMAEMIAQQAKEINSRQSFSIYV